MTSQKDGPLKIADANPDLVAIRDIEAHVANLLRVWSVGLGTYRRHGDRDDGVSN